MEKIVEAIKNCGEVNTFIGNMLDPIIEGIKFFEEFDAFASKYAHGHPETDELNFEIKLSHSLTEDLLKESGSNLNTNVEGIIKKKLQSGEDEALFRKNWEYN